MQAFSRLTPPLSLIRLLERFYETSLDQILIWRMPDVLQSTFEGFAFGESIWLSPEHTSWNDVTTIRVLAHEVCHVLQQRKGSGNCAGAAGFSDHRTLEAEARRAETCAAPFVQAGGRGDSLPWYTLQGTSRAPQPYVKMAINRAVPRSAHFAPGAMTAREADYALLTDVDAVWNRTAGIMRLQGCTPGEMLAARAVLRRWMGVTISGLVFTRPGEIIRGFSRDGAALARMAIGRSAELRHYNNYGELATALLGEVRAQPTALYEAALAKAVLRTQEIAEDLRVVAVKIVFYWDTVSAGRSWLTQVLGYSTGEPWSFRGAYFHYHHYLTPLSGLKKATNNTISVNIAVVHDTVDFIKSKAGDDHLFRQLQWTNPQTGAVLDLEKRDMRNNLGTINEGYAVIKHGRARRFPMQAGPSFTVSQMLALCELSGATVNEMTSVAYAIFAFWNQVYQKACTPIHTFYEVMVAAANFGVYFDSNRSYAHNAPLPVVARLIQIWEDRIETELL